MFEKCLIKCLAHGKCSITVNDYFLSIYYVPDTILRPFMDTIPRVTTHFGEAGILNQAFPMRRLGRFTKIVTSAILAT